MSVFQLFVAYVLSWFMTLFCVLPFGVKIPEKPGLGHAPSAPEHPQLKRKFAVTSVLAVLPVVVFWFCVTNHALAAEEGKGIYHAGGGDTDCVDYQAPADVSADSGTNGPSNVHSAITVPTADYISDPKLKEKIYTSETYIGGVDVNMKGETKLNGKLIGNKKCKPK